MHSATVEKASTAEMKTHLKERLAEIHVPRDTSEVTGSNPETGALVYGTVANPEYEAKVKYESERAAEGWNATCSCGWTGNNPHPSEGEADEAVEQHYATSNEPAGLGG